MYLSSDDFSTSVSSAFDFLKQAGFQEHGYELSSTRRGYYYFYSKNELTIRIHYSLTNDWIDVDFIYEPDARGIAVNRDDTLMLMIYLDFKGVQDYEGIMPKSVGFVKSVELVSDRVKTDAQPIWTESLKVTNRELL
jgi:hypothetical protein